MRSRRSAADSMNCCGVGPIRTTRREASQEVLGWHGWVAHRGDGFRWGLSQRRCTARPSWAPAWWTCGFTAARFTGVMSAASRLCTRYGTSRKTRSTGVVVARWVKNWATSRSGTSGVNVAVQCVSKPSYTECSNRHRCTESALCSTVQWPSGEAHAIPDAVDDASQPLVLAR